MYIITLILHYIIGYGILSRLKFDRSGWESFGLAFPLGLGSITLTIFLMDVLGIPLSLASITMATLLIALALFYPRLLKPAFNVQQKKNRFFNGIKKISGAEWIFLLVIVALFFISLWRCFYLPVTPYDAIHGIDLVAKYAVQEGHIDSRMFDDLKEHLSTQPYYAPFTALSQMIYRFSGHPFGKLWLSFMFLSLLIIFYVNIRQENHPIIAGLLTVMLIAIPELYAYTFLLQTDFSNAVFVSFSIIYAYHFIHEREMAYFWVSALLFGFGCWSRSETVSFAIIAALMLFLYLYFEESTKKPSPILYPAIFLGISFFFFAIWNLYYLPEVLNYTPESYFKFGFWDAERFATLWNGMMEILTTTVYWGYVFYIFLAVALVNLLFLRDRTNLFILLWIVLLFLGFLILLYHLQLNIKANINYTFRRGSFKLWIMMVYYIGTSALMMRLSSFVKKWEAN